MKLIRTKDGRIIDVEKFIKQEKENLNYSDFSDFHLKNKDDHCVIEWSAIGTKNNSITDQIGRRCQFGASIDSPFVKQANTIEKLICDDDILYIYDLYPDAVLVVEGKIKPFGYDEAIKLKDWLKYKHLKFDLLTKDIKGNYIKRAKKDIEEELELL